MDKLQKTYIAVAKRIEQIDFEKLWPGFHPFPFAMLDATKACIDGNVVPRPEEFRANTAIEYEGRLLATWYLTEEDSDIDLLTANIIHEMFHAFQMEQGEKRFGDDLQAMMHPVEQEILFLKYTENQLLLQSLTNKAMFEHFAHLRQHRRSIAKDAVNYELAIETIEGMAEYVGLKALEQIAVEKYMEKVEQHAANLMNVSNLLDMRRLAYSSGMILLLAAGTADISIFHQLGSEEQSVFEIVMNRFKHEEHNKLKKHLIDQHQEREKLVQKVVMHGEKQDGHFQIRGYDPMNMFRQENHIYGRHFWLLWDEARQKNIQIEGESVLVCGLEGEIESYYLR